MQFRGVASGQRVGERGREKGEGVHGSRAPWNLAFLQLGLIAMGHADEELIIKIKYSGERVRSYPSAPLPLADAACRGSQADRPGVAG